MQGACRTFNSLESPLARLIPAFRSTTHFFSCSLPFPNCRPQLKDCSPPEYLTSDIFLPSKERTTKTKPRGTLIAHIPSFATHLRLVIKFVPFQAFPPILDHRHLSIPQSPYRAVSASSSPSASLPRHVRPQISQQVLSPYLHPSKLTSSSRPGAAESPPRQQTVCLMTRLQHAPQHLRRVHLPWEEKFNPRKEDAQESYPTIKIFRFCIGCNTGIPFKPTRDQAEQGGGPAEEL
jgi:hypothetical protein